MSNNIKPDELQKTVLDMLEKWGYTTRVVMRQCAKEVGDETAEIVREHIDTVKTGEYKDSIICEEVSTGKKGVTTFVVHAGGEKYRLSHLLEHGHVVISHGDIKEESTKEHPHFVYGEEYADKELSRRFIEKANKEL